ncbi:MAG: TonB-dependent receptor [Pseudoxanthomonas sp.]
MKSTNSSRNLLAMAIVVGLASMPLAPAQAQSTGNAATTAASDEEETTTLGTMTVTAQKREEVLQDVPITMTVLPQQLLQDSGVRDIKDMQVLVPGLTVTSTGSETQTTVRIRGVGTVGDNPGLESSVGVVIDGVYRPRNGVGFGDLGEIERIEVLKGPQGTVFGKNTSAGVINVITRRPSYSQSTDAEITVGNYGTLGVSAAYNDALGENAAFRVYAAKRKRDGFNEVVTGAGPRTLDEDGDLNFQSLRGQLLWEPSDTVDVNFIADYTSREENCCVGETTVRGPTAAIINALAGGAGVAPVADPYARVAYSNDDTRQDIKDKGLSAEVNWETPWFGGATLTSITSGRDWAAISGADLDFTAADIWVREFGLDQNSVEFKTFSQEFRLTGSSEKLDWMVGFFHADEDLSRHDSINMGSAYEAYLSIALLSNIANAFPAGLVNTAGAATFLSQAAGRPYGTTFVGPGSHDVFEQNAKSDALFTNLTYHATDALDLTLGLRYTNERKQLESVYSNPNGGLGCTAGLTNPGQVGAALAGRGVPLSFVPGLVPTVIGYMCLPWSNSLHIGRVTDQKRDEKEWSGTVKAAYRWSDNVMTFLSGARGYKAGGFNLDRVQSSNGFSSGGSGIFPVDDTSFPGEFVDSYELGAKTTWMDGNLLLNASLFHQQYSDFQLNSFLGTSYVVRSIPELRSQGVDAEVLWQPRKGLMLQAGATYTDAHYGDDLLPDADLHLLPGNRAAFAPKWSGSAGLTYEWDFTSALSGRFNIGAKYSSSYNTGSDLDPQKQQQAYTLVNARLAIAAKDKRWAVELWAQNLTDEEYTQVGFDAPLQSGSWNAFLGAPRTYGVTLRLSY